MAFQTGYSVGLQRGGVRVLGSRLEADSGSSGRAFPKSLSEAEVVPTRPD